MTTSENDSSSVEPRMLWREQHSLWVDYLPMLLLQAPYERVYSVQVSTSGLLVRQPEFGRKSEYTRFFRWSSIESMVDADPKGLVVLTMTGGEQVTLRNGHLRSFGRAESGKATGQRQVRTSQLLNAWATHKGQRG